MPNKTIKIKHGRSVTRAANEDNVTPQQFVNDAVDFYIGYATAKFDERNPYRIAARKRLAKRLAKRARKLLNEIGER